MNPAAIERFDAFPFRHRVADLMSEPLVLAAEASLVEAARAMLPAHRSSVLLLDDGGRPAGIVTEHDLVRCFAEEGAQGLQQRLGGVARHPVLTVDEQAFLFVALGRMDRHEVRHLVAVDAEGRATGVLSARAVLRTRASAALKLGDSIAAAQDAEALKAVHDALPGLARSLLAEEVSAGEIAAVISHVNRDIARRAAELAAERVEAAQGPAPARWCYLVLGSAGREESLLAPDQDNALVHDGSPGDDDAWFRALGEIASDLQAAAGIPYCKGGVMASKPAWRHALPDWERLVRKWTALPEGEQLLSIDIFYDFVPVAGEAALAQALDRAAMAAAGDRSLPKMMARQLQVPGLPLKLLGGFRTEAGRLDLKRHGLYPIVAGARVLALALGEAARGTLARLAAARAAERLNEADHDALVAAFKLFQELILRQQVADLAAGLPAGTKVAVQALPRATQQRLKEALRSVEVMLHTVQGAVAPA
jgi:signal-transduction protein with cAMP-binding, CBS, and nucleotidyltransferase domain